MAVSLRRISFCPEAQNLVISTHPLFSARGEKWPWVILPRPRDQLRSRARSRLAPDAAGSSQSNIDQMARTGSPARALPIPHSLLVSFRQRIHPSLTFSASSASTTLNSALYSGERRFRLRSALHGVKSSSPARPRPPLLCHCDLLIYASRGWRKKKPKKKKLVQMKPAATQRVSFAEKRSEGKRKITRKQKRRDAKASFCRVARSVVSLKLPVQPCSENVRAEHNARARGSSQR